MFEDEALEDAKRMDKKRIKLIIVADPKRSGVAGAVKSFLDFAKATVEIVGRFDTAGHRAVVSKNCDYAIVFGGDGTIIAAQRLLSSIEVPVIGVNVGKLGYLAEFNIDELKKSFEKILAGRIKVEKRMMLHCRIEREGVQLFSSSAVNDVFINAGQPFRMIELRIRVDGQQLAGCTSDGMIIATPTGSTAYNLSSGGPIVSANMAAFVITPICPHSLSFRPIVINASSSVQVEGVKVNKGTTVSIDGQISRPLRAGDVVCVQKDKNQFLIVNNPVRTQWDTLAEKLGWAELPKYKKWQSGIGL